MVSGILWSIAAGFASAYLIWTIGVRNGDGPWFGVVIGLLVMIGGILRSVGI